MTDFINYSFETTLAFDTTTGAKTWTGEYVDPKNNSYFLGTSSDLCDLTFELAQLFKQTYGSIYNWDKTNVTGDVVLSFGDQSSHLKFEFFNFSYYLKDGELVLKGGDLNGLFKQYLKNTKGYTGDYKCDFSKLTANVGMKPWGSVGTSKPVTKSTTVAPKPVETVKSDSEDDVAPSGLFEDDEW